VIGDPQLAHNQKEEIHGCLAGPVAMAGDGGHRAGAAGRFQIVTLTQDRLYAFC
jgi:hypothetical protein